METINTDIDSYSIEDILSILNIIEPTTTNVAHRADDLISRYSPNGNEPNALMATFFTEAKDKVMNYLINMNTATPVEPEYLTEKDETIEEIWDSPEFKAQTLSGTHIFDDNAHFAFEPPNQATETNVVPIISTHIVNIDSQFRSNILPYSNNPLSNSYNTNFTFNLTNPISRAISIKLYSYQIPTSWYAFSISLGNTFFIYNGIIINIPDGNYNAQTLVAKINEISAENIATSDLLVSFNSESNRISFTNNNILSENITLSLFIQANVVNYNNCGLSNLNQYQTLGVNSTLGWLMGFRTNPDSITGDVYISLGPGATIMADAAPDTYGPKYFVLSIEDYSNQSLTNGLYNITNSSNIATISIPDFYQTTRIACRLREGQLTQAEIYTINAVTDSSKAKNTAAGFNNKASVSALGTAFAMIPLQDITGIRPNPYVKFGGDLIMLHRNYSAPTYLERLTVTLTDDKGNLVNLYDNDWSFSLIVEERLN
jgi:hypothetical protein